MVLGNGMAAKSCGEMACLRAAGHGPRPAMFNELFRTQPFLRIPYRYKEKHQIPLLGGLPGTILKNLPSHIIENLHGFVKSYAEFFWVTGRYREVCGVPTIARTRHLHIGSGLWVDFLDESRCHSL